MLAVLPVVCIIILFHAALKELRSVEYDLMALEFLASQHENHVALDITSVQPGEVVISWKFLGEHDTANCLSRFNLASYHLLEQTGNAPVDRVGCLYWRFFVSAVIR
jgi:hypothetical protein